MKNPLLIIMTFLYLSINGYTQPSWYYQNPVPVLSELKSVQFVSIDTGWAIGSYGDIIRTTNGGESWELQIANVDAVIDIYFVDDKYGWGIGSIFTGEWSWGGPIFDRVLLKTTDGGRSWNTQKIFEGYAGGPCPFPIFFIDREIGWMACANLSSPNYNSCIMKTTDGGENWSIQDSIALLIHDFYFVNNQVGWAVGGWSGAFEGTIFKTTDGGESWISQSSGVNGVLESICFISQNTGWTVGTDNIILKTTNGGTHWMQQYIGGTNCQLTSVCFTDSNHGFIAGWDIYLTTEDGGTTWSVITYPSPNALSVFFINQQIGWRVGCGGAVQKTTNGGDSWIDQYSSFTNDDFKQVDFIDKNKGWIISPTSIYHTWNAGHSWQLQKTVQNDSLNYIYAVDSLNCWVVGYDWGTSSSLIIKTTDGGNLWERQQVAFTSRLNSACFINNNVGWIVGDGGLILFTEDGGQTLIPQVSGVNGPLNSVDFINSNYGWIAGYNNASIILSTVDGGQNWSTIIQDTLEAFNSIEFVDSLEGWGVAGYCYEYCNGHIYHTSDGGINWELQYDGWAKYSSIKFINEEVGWVTGGGGFNCDRVLKTTDGGENWIAQVLPIGWRNRLDFVDINNGWIVGPGGLIMHTTSGGITFIEESGESIPQTQINNFTLYHNYPNPFNSSTVISYQIPVASNVMIKVYDVLGNEIATLADEYKLAGEYEVEFNATSLPSSVYFYQLRTGEFILTKKMILLK